MNSDIELKIGSTIYGKIQAARMSESERRVAITAMQDADAIADAILWVMNKVEDVGSRLFYKPTLKH